MRPMPRAPISTTRYLVSHRLGRAVRGTPSSLLRLPAGATVGPACSRSCASRSSVDVLPDRTGDADDLKTSSALDRSTEVARQPAERHQRICYYDTERPAQRGRLVSDASRAGRSRQRRHSHGHRPLARQGDEQSAGNHRTRVSGQRGDHGSLVAGTHERRTERHADLVDRRRDHGVVPC